MALRPAASDLRRLIPGATDALIAILDDSRGPVQPPIRSELFGLQRFAQHGRSLGETHRAVRAAARDANFFPRLRDNIRTLREAHRYIGVQVRIGYDISPAAEWLLDNFHLIEAQLRQIRDGLPRSYFRSLPLLIDEPLAGLPRIYGVAWAFVAHTDGAFDEELLVHFLCAYQETRELNLSEMWALPTTLRVVLIENLRRLAERVAGNKAAREAANLCCDHLEALTVATLERLLLRMSRRGVERVFLSQLAQRLRDQPQADAAAQPVRRWLLRHLSDAAAHQAQLLADQAADNLSVSNALMSLRAIGDTDWTDLVGRTSALMRRMLGSSLFESEHALTRDQTLHGIERLARRSGRSELEVAQALLERMQAHAGTDDPAAVAGHWLVGDGRPELAAGLGLREPWGRLWCGLSQRLRVAAYLGALGAGSVGAAAWLLARHGVDSGSPWVALAALLMLFPASEAVVALINRLISESVRPSRLPRLAFVGGIPAEHRVMVVIPTLLSDAHAIRATAHRLLLHHLANPEDHTQFALLTDWTDAPNEHAAPDEALLAVAQAEIQALNARHPMSTDVEAATSGAPRFVLLHRVRHFSPTEQRWIGWERKRGKLQLLIEALALGMHTAFVDLGRESRIAADTRYLVTLDGDTQLPPGRLRELVGVAAHPHNRPRLDATGHVVTGGYAILQPRVVTPLPGRDGATPYHFLFAGQCGIDPYSAATSEVYQDLFGEGSFSGKGLLHVQAVHAVLGDRLPEGRVLSHDLLEGAIARCAALSDITLIEDAPAQADVAAARVHRWMRGDWQLLPFLLPPWHLGLRAINRWKIFDNLRRSLVAPASLALLLLSLAGLALSPWAALAVVLAAFSAGPLMGAVAGFSPGRDDIAKRHFYRQAAIESARVAGAALWHLAMLWPQALAAADAIARAAYRMSISHRHLLQWTSFAATQASTAAAWPAVWRRHRHETLGALLLLGALLALGTPHAVFALLLCSVWAASPVWTWWVSRARSSGRDAVLPVADQTYLADVARDAWRLFERCIGDDDHHLPPDNLQTLPFDAVAHRTSPTNIGLYLLSVACARQFGWIGTHEMVARLEATLDTLERLPRHRGHWLNWYDTQTLAPLLPMYVSTVDSGNLAGHLLAVASACVERAQSTGDGRASERALAGAAQRVARWLDRRAELTPAQRDELRWCIADLRATRRSVARDAAGLVDAVPRLHALAQRCERLAWAPEFGFLYHRGRHLFHIGYRVAEQQLDAGFYDLLPSEARLTSLVAIAKGDVPVGHWSALGRISQPVGADAGLRSWSGSMFEYLMPTLVLDEPAGSVLHEASRAAVGEQIRFARARHLPWGISESAYAGRDHTLAYQYAPQGVPRLALRRTPTDELVVAPYATALAAQLAPRRARHNLAVLESLGARARYGFIEALDFSPARQTEASTCTPVATHMSHHQGMSIVALANVLLTGCARRWGMANAHIEAVASLLHERVPRELPIVRGPDDDRPGPQSPPRAPGLLREVLPGATALEPTHVLSNGRYGVELRANGAGCSRWGNVGVTRWRDDALRDAHGSFFFLRWDRQPQWVSLTQHPAPDPAAQYRSTYHADRVRFDAAWSALESHVTVWVSPEDDIEFRRVELLNLSDRVLDVELVSAFEVALSEPRADEAHPAFSNLFVRASWQAEHQALVFVRSPRLPHEREVQMAHFLADADPPVSGLRAQTDRLHWLGRNRAASAPLAALDALPTAAAQADGPPVALPTGLDPMCALAVRLRIAPRGKARLTFATAASDDGGTLQAVIDKYRQAMHVQRASLMSATLAGIRLRAQGITPETFTAIQLLTTALSLVITRPGGAAQRSDGADATRCDRRLLWRFGMSGDRPILLVSVGLPHGLGLLRSLVQGLSLWSWGGVACDLVVLNQEHASYHMRLQGELASLRDRHAAESAALPGPSRAAMHVLRTDELSADELGTLQRVARVRLQADGRPLLHHVQEWAAWHEQAFELRHEVSTVEVAPAACDAAAVPAPRGAFAPGTAAFGFDVGAQRRPQRPWINVLANAGFGALVSEAGGGYSWAVNSRLNQLTAWSNDPVADPPAEWFLLQDRRTLQVWSVAPSAWADGSCEYRVSHAQGRTVIVHSRGDLEVTASWCVDADTAVKQVQLRLVNQGSRTRHLRVVGIAEWMMGANRADRATVHTALFRQRLPPAPAMGNDSVAGAPRKLSALLCTQHESAAGFGEGTAFLALAGAADEADDWTCDRRECFDARGHLVLPDHFGQSAGDGLDPCAALSARLSLAPGASTERVFLLGHADSPDAARRLATLTAATPAAQRVELALAAWDRLLGATTVQTPDPLFDALVNRWLLYQVVSCRLWAKAGFYQAGGATGFRDQLQDTLALAWAAPALLRAQIVRCASRQYAEGDVQHWWHAPTGAGVRTRFSDDLLWLPLACAHYLRTTGDATLLDERAPFIEGAAIPAGAEDVYDTPATSRDDATVFEHAARTIDLSLRVGVHGLPLMGGGDWNDGMNRVGHEGRGESVWLGWFLCRVVADFAPHARARGESARALRWEQAAAGWQAALRGDAWDGQWFRRAFFDDGQALGASGQAEARIDLVAQAWAVLSGAAPPALQRSAMAAVERHLVDREAGLIRLLDPPLVHTVPSAGYIQAYPPGVRENGGQYTHAGAWALMAQAALAIQAADTGPDADIAYRYFTYLSPAHRAAEAHRGAVYGVEPYAVVADVYSQPPYVGRGGWSWYTGAAGWLHRAAVESIFGLQMDAQALCIRPCLPSHWPRAELTLARDGRSMRFIFVRADAPQAVARAGAPAQAALLPIGERVAWRRLAPHTCFVVALPPAADVHDASTRPDAVPI